MFRDRSLDRFLDELASKAPVPGGGSVAALSGALAAGLVSMVCNLTLGKERYAHVQDEIRTLLARSEELRRRLIELLKDDVQVYTKVSAAYKMPRQNEEGKKTRTEAIQAALKDATEIPMKVAEACVEILDLCIPVAEKGNVRAVSDVGVAALMAEAGLRGAALNVLINLGAIEDEGFCRREGARLDALLEGKSELKEEIYKLVEDKL
ncbi:MAG: cyclodeaminase/cyclohydrolase family protein [Dehalococcoidia bacterium]